MILYKIKCPLFANLKNVAFSHRIVDWRTKNTTAKKPKGKASVVLRQTRWSEDQDKFTFSTWRSDGETTESGWDGIWRDAMSWDGECEKETHTIEKVGEETTKN